MMLDVAHRVGAAIRRPKSTTVAQSQRLRRRVAAPSARHRRRMWILVWAAAICTATLFTAVPAGTSGVAQQHATPWSIAAAMPRPVRLAIAALLHTATPLLAVVTARLRWGHKYVLLRPFGGGVAFVILQAVGYTAWAVATLCYVALLLAGANQAPPHAAPTAAVAVFVAAVALGAAQAAFTPLAGDTRARAPERNSSIADGVTVGMIAAAEVILAGVAGAATHPAIIQTAAVGALVAHALAGAAAHAGLRLRSSRKTFHWFLPFAGRPVDVVIQAACWTFFALAVVPLWHVVWVPLSVPVAPAVVSTVTGDDLAPFLDVAAQGRHRGGPSAVRAGIIGAAANIGLLAHALWNAQASGTESQPLAAGSGQPQRSRRSSHKSALWAISILAAAVAAYTAIQGAVFGVTHTHSSDKLLLVFALACPVVTNGISLGRIARHLHRLASWHEWGIRSFVALQLVGWAFASAALVTSAIAPTTVAFPVALAAAAQAASHLSVSTLTRLRQHPPHVPHAALGVDVDLLRSPVARRNGIAAFSVPSYVAGVAASAIAVLLRLVCVAGATLARRSGNDLPAAPLHLSAGLWIAAVPLLQYGVSGADVFFRPLHGAPVEGALQALAWAVYSVTALTLTLAAFDDTFAILGTRFGVLVEAALMVLPPGFVIASTFYHRPPNARPLDHHHHPALTTAQLDLLTAAVEALPSTADRDALTRHTQSLVRSQQPRVEAPTNRETHASAIVVVAAALAVYSSVLFTAAEFASRDRAATSRGTITPVVTLGGSGLLTALLACGYAHVALGRALHADAFKLWMPFEGGSAFVVWQAMACSALCAAFTLWLRAVLECSSSSAAGAAGAAFWSTTLPAAAVLAFAAPLLMCASTLAFHPHGSDVGRLRWLKDHADGCLSVVILGAVWLLAAAAEFAGYHDDRRTATMLLIAGLIALIVAIPLAVVALKRATRLRRYTASAIRGSSDEDVHAMSEREEWADNESAAQTPLVSPRSPSASSRMRAPPRGGIRRRAAPTVGETGEQRRRSTHAEGEVPTHRAAQATWFALLHAVLEGAMVIVATVLPAAALYILGVVSWQSTTAARALLWSYRYALMALQAIVIVSLWSRQVTTTVARVALASTLYLHPILTGIFEVSLFFIFRLTPVGSVWLFLQFIVAMMASDRGKLATIIADIALAGIGSVQCVSRIARDVSVHSLIEHIAGASSGAAARFVLACAASAWYLSTYLGHPEETGSHFSPRFSAAVRRTLARALQSYFSFRVLVDAAPANDTKELIPVASLEPPRVPVMGYHPHGVYPFTTVWMTLSPQWRQAAQGRLPQGLSIHSASIIVFNPFVRDLALSLGCRLASRTAMTRALTGDAGRTAPQALILTPGGQAEMMTTDPARPTLRVVVYHLGFMRVAIEHGAPLVPLLGFGEHAAMGVCKLKRVQLFFLKHIGFAFPFIVYGWRGLPVPNPVPVTVVVGRAIDPVAVRERLQREGADTDPAAILKVVAQLYWNELRRIFYDNRAVAGYPDLELDLIESVHDI